MQVRASPDEITLRADEVLVNHIAKERWVPPLVGADWHAFCQALYHKGNEGEDWREWYDSYKEMSRAQPRMREENTTIRSV